MRVFNLGNDLNIFTNIPDYRVSQKCPFFCSHHLTKYSPNGKSSHKSWDYVPCSYTKASVLSTLNLSLEKSDYKTETVPKFMHKKRVVWNIQ